MLKPDKAAYGLISHYNLQNQGILLRDILSQTFNHLITSLTESASPLKTHRLTNLNDDHNSYLSANFILHYNCSNTAVSESLEGESKSSVEHQNVFNNNILLYYILFKIKEKKYNLNLN